MHFDGHREPVGERFERLAAPQVRARQQAGDPEGNEAVGERFGLHPARPAERPPLVGTGPVLPASRFGVADQVERHDLEPYARSITTMNAVTRLALRDLVGVRSGDKGDISDLTLFADDPAAYQVIVSQVTVDKVKEHFGSFVQGRVERFEAPNVLAVKFVMYDALGGGGPRSLRSDNLGKTLGAALLRLVIDVPDEVAERASRRGRRAPLERPPA